MTNQKWPLSNTELGQASTTLQTDIRRSVRTLSVLRTVKVQTPDEEGLARLQNISDEGVKLWLKLSMCLGDTVNVHLSDVDVLQGKVVWTNGEHCGLQLQEPVDSAALLMNLADRTRAGTSRAVRMVTDSAALAYSDDGVHPVQIKDVSQRGMKVQHGRRFVIGLPVKIQLFSGLEANGVVRWSDGDLAGLELLRPVGVDKLGRARDFGE